MGTVDTARLDPDSLPRKLAGNTRAAASSLTPYWALSAAQAPDRDATFSGGASSRPVFRTYRLRLEGWRGIVGHTDAQDDWEILVEGVTNALQLANQAVARQVSGFMRFANVTGSPVDIAQIGNSRAHHAVIECEAEVYEVIS